MFRGIIPAIGGIDLSPMLAFFLLNFLRGALMVSRRGKTPVWPSRTNSLHPQATAAGTPSL
jgi:hypothetical protein